MTAAYVEIDPFAAQWLRNLIAAGHIAPGDVLETDVRDIRPADLAGYMQVHLYAGIGVWSLALRRAGWPDDRPVWTFSEPCQPFSSAGRGLGFADERYLRPYTHHLVSVCRPRVCFGEQVASKDGLAWLDVVHADMEGAGYAFGAVDLCAAGVGAPHIRQRLKFVAELADAESGCGRPGLCDSRPAGLRRDQPSDSGQHGGLADADGRQQRGLADLDERHVGHGQDAGRPEGDGRAPARREHGELADGGRPGPTNGPWRDADWLFCRDGKWRPVEPKTFPLVNGAPGRVGRLRAYGNAIVAQAAQEFVEAYLDVRLTDAGMFS